jgi:hypothetical protein
MAETMTDPTRTSGPEAFRAAAAGPGDGAYESPEQKIARLQARLDAVAEKSDDTHTALLLNQVSDRFSGRIAGILPFIPFLEGGGAGMGSGNNMLPLVLALTLSDDRHQDIGRILPFILLSDGGGAGMGSGNNMLPLVLALTLSDDGSGGSRAGERMRSVERLLEEALSEAKEEVSARERTLEEREEEVSARESALEKEEK